MTSSNWMCVPGYTGVSWRPVNNDDPQRYTAQLAEPLQQHEPICYVVDSTSDPFHVNVPFKSIAAVLGVMAACPQHLFIIVTKHPKRMLEVITGVTTAECVLLACQALPRMYTQCFARTDVVLRKWPLPNVWLGVNIGAQVDVDANIPLLLRCPAAVRLVSVSVKPMLGPIKLTSYLGSRFFSDVVRYGCRGVTGEPIHPDARLPQPSYIDWVVIDVECDSSARPYNAPFIKDIVRQCSRTDTPCFVRRPDIVVAGHEPDDASNLVQAHPYNHQGMKVAEWPEDLRVHQFPKMGH